MSCWSGARWYEHPATPWHDRKRPSRLMIPLVIVAGPRALPTAAVASRYYAAAGIAATVVRPANCLAHDGSFYVGTTFIDDEALAGVEMVSTFLKSRRADLAAFNRSPGWFLQQFIKLAAVSALGTPFVFIADGDTVFSTALLNDVLRSPTILTTGETYENYDRLVRELGLVPTSRSCVANGNIFSQAEPLQVLATPAGFETMLSNHVLPSRGTLDFSEYQVTGSILEPRIGSRPIRMFRRFDLLVADLDHIPERRVAQALRRYDVIAIEANHHRSTAKRLAAHLFYAVRRSW